MSRVSFESCAEGAVVLPVPAWVAWSHAHNALLPDDGVSRVYPSMGAALAALDRARLYVSEEPAVRAGYVAPHVQGGGR